MYIEVTNDKYEFPLNWGNTADELGRILGTGKSNVYKKVKRSLEAEKYPYMKTKIIAVEITDDVD